MTYVVLYLTALVEGLICIRACHSGPYGVNGSWSDLWLQLTYRRPTIPIASINVRAAKEPT